MPRCFKDKDIIRKYQYPQGEPTVSKPALGLWDANSLPSALLFFSVAPFPQKCVLISSKAERNQTARAKQNQNRTSFGRLSARHGASFSCSSSGSGSLYGWVCLLPRGRQGAIHAKMEASSIPDAGLASIALQGIKQNTVCSSLSLLTSNLSGTRQVAST